MLTTGKAKCYLKIHTNVQFPQKGAFKNTTFYPLKLRKNLGL